MSAGTRFQIYLANPKDGVIARDLKTARRSVHQEVKARDLYWQSACDFNHVIGPSRVSSLHSNERSTNHLEEIVSLVELPLEERQTSQEIPKGSAEKLNPTTVEWSDQRHFHMKVKDTLRGWGFELAAITFSILSFVSIIGVLISIENQPLSSWSSQYQPNSVISQLMTVSRSSLMLSTASCISQSTWLRFRQHPRQLLDIQRFDDASRGPLGASKILFGLSKYGWLALIGSLVTIATLLVDSFTQQAIGFPTRQVASSINASYLIAQEFAPLPADELLTTSMYMSLLSLFQYGSYIATHLARS